MSTQFNSKISQKKTPKLLWISISDEEQEIVRGRFLSTEKPPGDSNSSS